MNRVLHEATHELGLGLVARTSVEDVGPEDVPTSGAEWPRALDLPRLRLRLYLPGAYMRGSEVVPSLQSSEQVLGEALGGGSWGQDWDQQREARWVWREVVVGRERHSTALAELLATVGEAVETLRGVVGARAARLAAREATLVAVRDVPEAQSSR